MSMTLTPDELAHQQHVLTALTQRIKTQGKLRFDAFMKFALYEPGLGYYTAGMKKIGADGDFITAPEVSPLFSQCLANQCHEFLVTLPPQSKILELGAGSGKMAGAIMQRLTQLDKAPEQYLILEISPDLKARQQAYIQKQYPDLFSRFQWLDTLPTQPFTGIILANEVLDALPVHLFKMGANDQVLEGYVSINDHVVNLEYETASEAVIDALQQLQQTLPEPMAEGYCSEINLLIEPLIRSLNDILEQGAMIWIDYGFPDFTYYHPSRGTGTLMCHFKHRAHSDPFVNIGLQDITAHVDFSCIARTADALQLEIFDYATQGQFLIDHGLIDLAQASTENPLKISQQIQTLTQPHEMGELFKIMILGKKLGI